MPRTRALLFTAGVMVCLGRAPCLAASDPVHDPGIKIYRGQLEKERARALEGGDTGLWRVGPGAEAMTLDAIDEPGPSFPIHTLVQEGDRLLDDARFKRLTEQFLGKPLGLRRINYLLDQINRALVDMGYITSRAYVGRQNLKDGVLAVMIVAGRIERLLYNDQDASTASSLSDLSPALG
jgi:hemolysin activation/secretion protein